MADGKAGSVRRGCCRAAVAQVRLNVLEAALRASRLISGGMAASGHWSGVRGLARAEPRFTRDIDIAVAVSDDADGEDLVRLLLGTGTGCWHRWSKTRPGDWPPSGWVPI